MNGLGRTFALYKSGVKPPICFFGNHTNAVPNGIVSTNCVDEFDSSYRGYFKNYLPNGIGIMNFSCGKSYLGEMKDGK